MTPSIILYLREEIAKTVMKTFLTACDPWGVSVERVEVKNLSVAREMVKSLAVEAQASREVRETEGGENHLEVRNVSFRPKVFSSCRKAKAEAWRR